MKVYNLKISTNDVPNIKSVHCDKKPGLSHSLFSVRAASLRQRQRGWNCQIRSLWEGAGTIFRIDEKSGDLHATQRLDREEKASYILQAQAFNKITGLPLEPATEFIVKIHDINDNEPKFTKAVYTASVPEMSDVGEWMKITFPLCVVIWSAFTVMLKYCTRVWYSCHCSVFKVMDASVPLVFLRVFFFLFFNFDKYLEHVVLWSGASVS